MNAYEELMNFKGAEELHRLIKKWNILSENISKRSFDAPIVLPDLFVYTKPGYGNTKLLAELSEYLDSKANLMTFYGDVKFFEYKLEYCNPDHDFDEMHRFRESVEAAAGFRNEFKGIIRVNVDDWVGHHNEKHFLDFLRYLQVNTAYWMIILTISSYDEDDKTREMEAIVSMYLRIEKITLHLPSDKELVECIAHYLSKYGLELDEGAKDVLLKSVSVLRENKFFYGMHTIEALSKDIVYNLLSETSSAYDVITAEMLEDFSADSEYIKRTVVKFKKREPIGF